MNDPTEQHSQVVIHKDRQGIFYASQQTPLGTVMIGATKKGICFLQFDDTVKRLLEKLKAEYPKAEIKPVTKESLPLFDRWMDALDAFLNGRAKQLTLPLDVHGTAFQKSVWKYLTTIPTGELKSYKEVSRAIGRPTAFRAVANACSSNKIAIAVPCHRVVCSNGNLAGFKWGLMRKQMLIDLERSGQKQSHCS